MSLPTRTGSAASTLARDRFACGTYTGFTVVLALALLLAGFGSAVLELTLAILTFTPVVLAVAMT